MQLFLFLQKCINCISLMIFSNNRQNLILCPNLASVAWLPNMQEDSSHSPTYTVSCEDYVHVVEFSPFSSGTPMSFLAYGGNQYVVVGTCLFQVRVVASCIPFLLKYPFLNTYFSHRRRMWRLRELNLMFYELSIMNCALMLLPGAPIPDWTGYHVSGTIVLVFA